MGDRSDDRSWEYALYGTPMYAFSDSPDGRIVGELNKMRQNQQESDKQYLQLQQQATEDIRRIHDGQLQVNREAANIPAIAGVLSQLVDQMQRIGDSKDNIISEVDVHSDQIRDELIRQTHSIKGPEPKQEQFASLINNAKELADAIYLLQLDALNEEGRNGLFAIIDQAINQFLKPVRDDIFALRNNDQPGAQDLVAAANESLNNLSTIRNILSDPQKAAQSIATVKRLARIGLDSSTKTSLSKLGVLLRQFMNPIEREISKELLVRFANSDYLSDQAANNVMEKYPEGRRRPSMASINFNLADIRRTAIEGVTHLGNLEQIGQEGIGQRRTMIDQNSEMIGQNREMIGLSGRTAAATERLVKLEEWGLDTLDDMSEDISKMVEQNEMMIDQGNTQMELLDEILEANEEAIEQRKKVLKEQRMANYRLEEITRILIENNEEIVDLQDLVSTFNDDFMEQSKRLGKKLKRLNKEVVLTRQVVTSRIKKSMKAVGKKIDKMGSKIRDAVLVGTSSITSAVERGNSLLEDILQLQISSQTSKAAQRYREGQAIIETSTGNADLKDAYESFIQGTKENRAFAENYYGAGITSELLGNTDEAIIHYDKAARRATPEQQQMSSSAFQKKGVLLIAKGEAMEASLAMDASVLANPSNRNARFLQIATRLQAGRFEDIETIILLWAEMDEKQVPHLLTHPAYLNAPTIIKDKVLTTLANADTPKNSVAFLSVLESAIEISSLTCTVLFYRMLIRSPGLFKEKRLWRHPKFIDAKGLFDWVVEKLVDQQLQSFTAAHCFDLMVILKCCNGKKENIRSISQRLQMLRGGDDLLWKLLEAEILTYSE